jgi:hypothetical protein
MRLVDSPLHNLTFPPLNYSTHRSLTLSDERWTLTDPLCSFCESYRQVRNTISQSSSSHPTMVSLSSSRRKCTTAMSSIIRPPISQLAPGHMPSCVSMSKMSSTLRSRSPLSIWPCLLSRQRYLRRIHSRKAVSLHPPLKVLADRRLSV